MTSMLSDIHLHDSKYAAHQRMANAIIEITLKQGSCAPDDLLALGFRDHETVVLFHMANEMASVELRLMENRKRYASGR